MKIQETVIVKVSILGMPTEGMGDAVFEINVHPETPADLMAGLESLSTALATALGAAMDEVQPNLGPFLREKYKDGPELDSGPGF